MRAKVKPNKEDEQCARKTAIRTLTRGSAENSDQSSRKRHHHITKPSTLVSINQSSKQASKQGSKEASNWMWLVNWATNQSNNRQCQSILKNNCCQHQRKMAPMFSTNAIAALGVTAVMCLHSSHTASAFVTTTQWRVDHSIERVDKSFTTTSRLSRIPSVPFSTKLQASRFGNSDRNDDDHDSDSSQERAHANNKARTDVRLFLTQRSFQSFLHLLNTCRDPHTVRWLTEFGGWPESFTEYHGLGGFGPSITEWDTLLLDLMQQPQSEVVVRAKRRGRGHGGWSKNNPYLPVCVVVNVIQQ